jgi:hypothetical protein
MQSELDLYSPEELALSTGAAQSARVGPQRSARRAKGSPHRSPTPATASHDDGLCRFAWSEASAGRSVVCQRVDGDRILVYIATSPL